MNRDIILNKNDSDSGKYRMIGPCTSVDLNLSVCNMAFNFVLTESDIMTYQVVPTWATPSPTWGPSCEVFFAKEVPMYLNMEYGKKNGFQRMWTHLYNMKSHGLEKSGLSAEYDDMQFIFPPNKDIDIPTSCYWYISGDVQYQNYFYLSMPLQTMLCATTFTRQIPSNSSEEWYFDTWKNLYKRMTKPELSVDCWHAICPFIKDKVNFNQLINGFGGWTKDKKSEDFKDNIQTVFSSTRQMPYSFSAYKYDRVMTDDTQDFSQDDSMPVMKYIDADCEFLFDCTTSVAQDFDKKAYASYIDDRTLYGTMPPMEILSVGMDLDYDENNISTYTPKYICGISAYGYELSGINPRPYAWRKKPVRSFDLDTDGIIPPVRLVNEGLKSLSYASKDLYLNSDELLAVSPLQYNVEHVSGEAQAIIDYEVIVYGGIDRSLVGENMSADAKVNCTVLITPLSSFSPAYVPNNTFKADRKSSMFFDPVVSSYMFEDVKPYFGDHNYYTNFFTVGATPFEVDLDWQWQWLSLDEDGCVHFSHNSYLDLEAGWYPEIKDFYRKYEAEMLALFPDAGEGQRQQELDALLLEYNRRKKLLESELSSLKEQKEMAEMQFLIDAGNDTIQDIYRDSRIPSLLAWPDQFESFWSSDGTIPKGWFRYEFNGGYRTWTLDGAWYNWDFGSKISQFLNSTGHYEDPVEIETYDDLKRFPVLEEDVAGVSEILSERMKEVMGDCRNVILTNITDVTNWLAGAPGWVLEEYWAFYNMHLNDPAYVLLVERIRVIEEVELPALDEWYDEEYEKIMEKEYPIDIPHYTILSTMQSPLYWWDNLDPTAENKYEYHDRVTVNVVVPKQREYSEQANPVLSTYLTKTYPSASYPLRNALLYAKSDLYTFAKENHSLTSAIEYDISSINCKRTEYDVSMEKTLYSHLQEQLEKCENTIDYDGDGRRFGKSSIAQLSSYELTDYYFKLEAKGTDWWIPYFKDAGYNNTIYLDDEGTSYEYRVLYITLAPAGTPEEEVVFGDYTNTDLALGDHRLDGPEVSIPFHIPENLHNKFIMKFEQLSAYVPPDQCLSVMSGPYIFSNTDYSGLIRNDYKFEKD